jgi:hypothetical protein
MGSGPKPSGGHRAGALNRAIRIAFLQRGGVWPRKLSLGRKQKNTQRAEPVRTPVVVAVLGARWGGAATGESNHHGETIVSSGGSQGDELEERARRHNSTLRGLIDAIGTVLAASRELLARLQGHPRQDEASGRGAAPDADQPSEPSADKPNAHRLKADATAPAASKFHLRCLLAG